MNPLESDMQQRVRELERENAKLRGVLSRYFSDDITQKILTDEVEVDFGGRLTDATILFFDIRNSTEIAESIPPSQFAELLSDVLTDVMDLVYGNRGSVNKLLGDGLMATFGCPVASEDYTLSAARTALQIIEYLKSFNDVKPDYLRSPLNAGVGIATGRVFAGNIGSVRRMEYAVLGDAVNVSSRLEALTKTAGVPILIDGNTRHALGGRIRAKRVQFDSVRGKNLLVEIYSLEGIQEGE
jgi:class 3 adenylate cyclase